MEDINLFVKFMINFLKDLNMTLKNQTPIGLTFGQILSVIGLVGALFAAWININMRITASEVKIEQLEKGRIQNAINIETIRIENRDDHKQMMLKLDLLIKEIK